MIKQTLLAAMILTSSSLSAATIYVSPDGSPKGDGSLSKPLNSLTAARDKIRSLRSKGANSEPYEVIIQEGHYQLSEGLSLIAKDSGTPSHPIVYRCEEGKEATFFGGAIIPYEWFKPLDKSCNFASKLVDKSVADKIIVVDLKRHGINDFGTPEPHGWGLESPNRVPVASLTIDGSRMTLSRWPNKGEQTEYIHDPNNKMKPLGLSEKAFAGYVSYTTYVNGGIGRRQLTGQERFKWYESERFMKGGGVLQVAFDRFSKWEYSREIFVDGILSASWEYVSNRVEWFDAEKKQFKVEMGNVSNGLGAKSLVKVSHFYFEGVAEELDQAGEYFIDRKQGVLYLYPPVGFTESSSIVISMLETPALKLGKVENVTFKGITFDTGRNLFAKISSSKNITIEGCTIRNFVAGGIDLIGYNSTIRDNEISGIGGYGVCIDGGDLKSLEPGENIVDNNHIHDFGWDQKSQIPGVYLRGVGNIVSNNKIHDAPHFAMRVNASNDCIIEGNEIYDVVKYHRFDGGAIYVQNGSEVEKRGLIIRNNYIHDICNNRNGIYLDNFATGNYVNGNIFERVHNSICTNSGHDNYLDNNIFIDSPIPIMHSSFAYKSIYPNSNHKSYWAEVSNMLLANIENMPHKKYEDLIRWCKLSDEEKRRGVSYARNNIIYYEKLAPERGVVNGVSDKLDSMVTDNNQTVESDPRK